MTLVFSLLIALMQPPFADAADSSYVLCKNRKIVRTLRVVTDEDSSCKTAYTKEGRDQVIGSGRFEETCHSFLRNVRRNLEEANWKCRDISHAEIAVSSEASLTE